MSAWTQRLKRRSVRGSGSIVPLKTARIPDYMHAIAQRAASEVSALGALCPDDYIFVDGSDAP